jgi:hypothetical protein
MPNDIMTLLRLSRYVCNTSGSGKTRILLEGLHNNWGFYFTALNKPDGVGSSDLGLVVDQLKPRLQILPSLEANAIEEKNSEAALRAFYGVLLIRVVIFHAFLLSAQQQPGGITESTKRAWLLLQLSPYVFFQTDKFFDLSSTHTHRHPSEQLRELLIAELDSVRGILGKNTTLFIALDEAQMLAHMYEKYFLSNANSLPRVPRPVIRNLVEIWSQHIPNIIISGTGLSMKSLEDALQSVVAKVDAGKTEPVIDIGAFETDGNQRAYLERYLPLHFLTTESGERLASRIGFWLHGRFIKQTYIYNSMLIYQSDIGLLQHTSRRLYKIVLNHPIVCWTSSYTA